jgi:K+-transporting ATPase KdpF subunit
MTLVEWLGLALALALCVYLVIALLYPERFQ